LSSIVLALALTGNTFVPPNGYVPNAVTATKIAEAVLIPIYGKADLECEKPLHAVLRGDVWFVTGTIPKYRPAGVIIEINRIDGRIVGLNHTAIEIGGKDWRKGCRQEQKAD
jgi:hypothetical protein